MNEDVDFEDVLAWFERHTGRDVADAVMTWCNHPDRLKTTEHLPQASAVLSGLQVTLSEALVQLSAYTTEGRRILGA